jgi:hypothetical protein
MRIENAENRQALARVGIELTRGECRELIDSLTALMENGSGRHEHVASLDFKTEVTVWLAAPDA